MNTKPTITTTMPGNHRAITYPVQRPQAQTKLPTYTEPRLIKIKYQGRTVLRITRLVTDW